MLYCLGDPAYLLVANRYYIRNISLASSEFSQTLVTRNLVNAVGLDYDWKEQMIYWADVTSEEHNISRMYMNGTGKQVCMSGTGKQVCMSGTCSSHSMTGVIFPKQLAYALFKYVHSCSFQKCA